MGDPIVIAHDGRGMRASLPPPTREAPTLLTHVVSLSTFPQEEISQALDPERRRSVPPLDVNATLMFYDDQTRPALYAGQLYLGVIASHSNKMFLIRVELRKKTKAARENGGDGPLRLRQVQLLEHLPAHLVDRHKVDNHLHVERIMSLCFDQ